MPRARILLAFIKMGKNAMDKTRNTYRNHSPISHRKIVYFLNISTPHFS